MELKPCPVCGAKAYLLNDVVDGFWFGYSVGCPRYCLYDGIHGHTFETPEDEHYSKHYFTTKEQAADWWNRRADDGTQTD